MLRSEGGVSALTQDPRWHWFPAESGPRGQGHQTEQPDCSLGSRTPGALCGWRKTGDRPCTHPPCGHRSACHHQPRHAPHSCSRALRSAPNAERSYPFRTLIRASLPRTLLQPRGPVHWLSPGLQSSLGYPCDPPPSQVFKEAHPVTQFKMTAQFHNPAFRHPDLVCFLSHWASSHKPRYLRIRNVSPPH